MLDYDTPYAIKDVGKLGRALAMQSFFGESVLRVSTPRGERKRGLQALDPETHIHIDLGYLLLWCQKWIITESESANWNFQMYRHNRPRPCPFLYTSTL